MRTIALSAGAAGMIFFLVAPPLVEFGLAVRQLQKVADTYAVALADRPLHGIERKQLRRQKDFSLKAEQPPASGEYRGDVDAVKVEVTTRWHSKLSWSPFAPRLLRAEATAAVLRDGTPDGIWVLRVE